MKKQLLLPLLLMNLTVLVAQNFTPVTNSIITQNSFTSWGNSWVDYDNDNDFDLFVNDKDQHRLYRNDGGGVFTNVTPSNLGSPVPLGFYYTAGWADYNNDGYADVYMGNDGDDNALLRGGPGGVFTAITTGQQVTDGFHSFNVSWVDYNNDGFTDIFCSNLQNEKNNLYRNNNGATFTKITAGNIVNDIDESWAHGWADYNNDRCPDLFVANLGNDFLYTNNCNGTFTKVLTGTIVNDGRDSESVSWGDYNNDGFLDMFVSVWGDKCMLYKNNSDGTFTKILVGSIVNNTNSGTGSCWGDYDNDGDLDIYVCTWNNEADRMYENNGDGTFTEITTGPLVANAIPTNGCTWIDYDNDGDQDLYVTNKATDNFLFRNDGNSNSWINIKLKGITSNAMAIGAKVRIKATINSVPVWQMREIGGMTGQFAQTGLNAAFGFGNATVLDSIIVEWPSGATCYFTNVAVNQFLVIDENCTLGNVSVNEPPQENLLRISTYPNPFASSITLSYSLSSTTDVHLAIVNLLCEKTAEFDYAVQQPGRHEVVLDATQFGAAGIYLYILTAGDHQQSGRIIYNGN